MQKKHPEKVSEEVVHDNGWWQYKKDSIKRPDGEAGEYYYGETRGAAMVVPMLQDGRLVIIRQFRYLTQKYGIEFPCGGIGDGERPVEAAERELLEETGTKADNLISLGSYDSLNGCFKDQMHVFFAPYVNKVEEQPKGDGTEDIEVMYRRPDEFEDMIRRGEVFDGQTLAAWALAREHVLAE